MSVPAPAWAPAAVPTPGAAPDGARMDAVELLVHDLDAMTAFYQQAVTLDVLDQSGPAATLGRGGVASIVLRQEKDLPGRDARGAGLYHTAIVFQDERRLAGALASMAQRAGHLYQGSADHLVSEAFYFADPEGNGLELYRDRPRDQWQVGADGTIRMGVEFLDPNRFLSRWYDPDSPADDGASGDDGVSAAIGHVHLQVGDIPTARRFYEGVLGFDVTAAMDSALFLSAGGYHHHIGMNTWHSAGAGPRAATLGLGDVRIVVPARDDVEALADRLRHHGVASADDGRTLRLADPWGTRLAVTPEASG
ncbi:VOC family protein [Myceligenerans xiligouense]|uniref:Catechol 2,3-dioxygenase n=1 Tax=Myceligenerans xiligouense TaxID=253184 RepID=A0A3N4Z8N3_9MICO|nr:VOC family protein [Myceligenerans xiligouense]RPF22228.1 catechol 2,3-dioxygenase [Myceligenerans xiligouense]